MKVLILNGSPRPDGDTEFILEKLKKRFPQGTEIEEIKAFEAGIQPCTDCRYCWENEGCSISDRMDAIWKDDYDVLVLASPVYMSFVTPPLFSIITRLNAIWSNRVFLKREKPMKRKKGILVLAGGGNGAPNPAIRIAKTAFSLLNAEFDPERDYIRSLNTDRVFAREDTELDGQTDEAVGRILR